MSRELEELTEQIQECVAKCHLLPTPPPYMGMLCCTYYEADGIWHRARVISKPLHLNLINPWCKCKLLCVCQCALLCYELICCNC